MAEKMLPMKGSTVEDSDLVKLKFPLLGSRKIDGYRGTKWNAGPLLTPAMKPIPNAFVNKELSSSDLIGVDGELVVGPPNAHDMFQRSAAIRRQGGEPDFRWYVFDHAELAHMSYEARHRVLSQQFADHPRIIVLEQTLINNLDELNAFDEESIQLGYEGAMYRTPHLPGYKFGRSTIRDGLLLRRKPYKDAEGEIVGFEEQLHNANEAELDERGHTKRAGNKENMIPKDTLGAFILRNEKLWPGVEFRCGTGRGWTAEFKQYVWNNREKYLGKWMNFVYQHIGSKDRPRQPIGRRFRDADDINLSY